MQESFHGLLVHNTGTSSIPVRPPSCPSLSFSLPLPLIWDLAHLLRIALRLTRVNILRARRSPSSIRPVLTKPKHRQEHHSRHPPSCSPFPLPSSLLHRQQHLQVFSISISSSVAPSSRHPRPLSAPRSLLCSRVNVCHAGAGGRASSVRNDNMLTPRWAARKPLPPKKKKKKPLLSGIRTVTQPAESARPLVIVTVSTGKTLKGCYINDRAFKI